jgi:hypothetical protein
MENGNWKRESLKLEKVYEATYNDEVLIWNTLSSLKLDPVNRQTQKGNLFPQSKEYAANLIFELKKPLIGESLDVMMLTSMGDGLI